jgi:hypothetical protein
MLHTVAGCVLIYVCSSSLGGGRSDEKEEGWLDGLLEEGKPEAPI